MRVFSGEEAYKQLHGNKYFRWAMHKTDTPPAPSRTGKAGFLPNIKPKFKMADGEKLFTIGSCFAREIENAMRPYGYTFSTQDPANRVSEDECTSATGFFNKFTTASMLNEVRWALSEGTSFPEDGFIETARGRWIDGQMHASFATRERAVEVRRNISKVFSDIRNVDYLVLTLGLVECWYDAATDLHLNVAPEIGTIRKFPGRFSLKILDYATNLKWMEEIYSIVKAVKPSMRFIVTVSPVPLAATFTGDDIAVANNYSKSTLRAVAGDFVIDRDDADYFPSYEIVTESAPSIAWLDDHIHVRHDLVQCIVAHFLAHYGCPRVVEKVNVAEDIARLNRRALQLVREASAVAAS